MPVENEGKTVCGLLGGSEGNHLRGSCLHHTAWLAGPQCGVQWGSLLRLGGMKGTVPWLCGSGACIQTLGGGTSG